MLCTEPGGPSQLQSTCLVAAVAELGVLGGMRTLAKFDTV